MKTIRRTIATAAIGLMAAGVIGLAAPAASASPVNDTQIGISGCGWYKNKSDHYLNRHVQLRAKGDWSGARWAYKKHRTYLDKYHACRF